MLDEQQNNVKLDTTLLGLVVIWVWVGEDIHEIYNIIPKLDAPTCWRDRKLLIDFSPSHILATLLDIATVYLIDT